MFTVPVSELGNTQMQHQTHFFSLPCSDVGLFFFFLLKCLHTDNMVEKDDISVPTLNTGRVTDENIFKQPAKLFFFQSLPGP